MKRLFILTTLLLTLLSGLSMADTSVQITPNTEAVLPIPNTSQVVRFPATAITISNQEVSAATLDKPSHETTIAQVANPDPTQTEPVLEVNESDLTFQLTAQTVTTTMSIFIATPAQVEIIPYLQGTINNDVLFSFNHGDTLTAGAGNDVVYGGEGNDILQGEAGSDKLYGEGGQDTLFGGSENDILYGGAGDDTLYGGAGNDILFGEGGNDTLFGGTGNDTLLGGEGNDIFGLVLGEDADIIVTFVDGQDKLGLPSGINFTDLLIMPDGNNTRIVYGAETLATLQGIESNLITNNDFTNNVNPRAAQGALLQQQTTITAWYLYYWDESQQKWRNATVTCDIPGEYNRAESKISIPICRPGQFTWLRITTNPSTTTPTPTPTSTNTPIPPTATNTPIPTPTPQVAPPDAYEIDNRCPEAKAITTDGVPQEHTFHVQADEDWVVFQATQGMTYTIEGRVPPTSQADLILEVWGDCSQAVDNQHLPFAADAQLQIVAPFSGKIYLHLLDESATNFGATVNYYLSVRAWETPPQHGAVIIVAGQYKENDHLQANIEQVTAAMYRLFLQKGHPKERLRYLSTNLNLDMDGDFKSDVDGLPNQLNLQSAITTWAKDKVGPNQALTIFLMDHGNYDKFYLDRPRNQLLKPSDLDSWLTELETATNVKVNVIIEACQSGSFIDQLEDPLQTIRRDGRMIIAATGAYPPSYATQNGAVFSDAFLSALAQDQDLRAAFDDGRWAAESLPKDKIWQGYQTPWLNGDDNSIPNQPSDYQVAAQRGFGITGSFPGDEVWPPYIAQAEIRNWNGQTGQIWAQVLDDLPENNTVWAVLYPPSYQPPTDPTEIVPEPSRLTLLRGAQVVNGWEYSSNWLFNEAGSYQLVIYAKDDDGLLSRPSVITLSTAKRVYLPLIVK